MKDTKKHCRVSPPVFRKDGSLRDLAQSQDKVACRSCRLAFELPLRFKSVKDMDAFARNVRVEYPDKISVNRKTRRGESQCQRLRSDREKLKRISVTLRRRHTMQHEDKTGSEQGTTPSKHGKRTGDYRTASKKETTVLFKAKHNVQTKVMLKDQFTTGLKVLTSRTICFNAWMNSALSERDADEYLARQQDPRRLSLKSMTKVAMALSLSNHMTRNPNRLFSVSHSRSPLCST